MNIDDEPRERGALADSAMVLAELENNRDSRCPACGSALCGHDVILSLVCGYKSSPHCLSCAADDMDLPASDLARRTWLYVRGRECFLTGWKAASLREEVAAEGIPACFEIRSCGSGSDAPQAPEIVAGDDGFVDETWDAGELSCGELLLELRRRLRRGRPGGTFALRALDSSAPEDIPAWCELTGNTLLRAKHPLYWIRSRAA